MGVERDRHIARKRRHRRLRRRLIGEPERPRLCVTKSDKHIYAQVIDDRAGRTLAAASTRDSGVAAKIEGPSRKSIGAARAVGLTIAERAKEAGIGEVVFDRGGWPYHGRIKALAEAAREGGLQF